MTNNIERVNKEDRPALGRRRDLPETTARLSAWSERLLIEQNDEWLLTRGYPSKESIEVGAMRGSTGEFRCTTTSRLDCARLPLGRRI